METNNSFNYELYVVVKTEEIVGSISPAVIGIYKTIDKANKAIINKKFTLHGPFKFQCLIENVPILDKKT